MRYFIVVFLWLFCFVGFSQETKNYFSGLGVNLNYSKKLTGRLSLKMSAEHRSAKRLGTIEAEGRQDLTVGVQRSLNQIYKVAVGGMYRNSNFDNKQRLYQQIGILQRTLTRVDFVHRLRIDETFSPDPTEYRLRYRFGFDMPTQGYKVDPGEGYIAILSEFLGKFEGSSYNPELRLATQFGYLFKNKNKGEFELEFRYDDPANEGEKLIVFNFGYYFSK